MVPDQDENSRVLRGGLRCLEVLRDCSQCNLKAKLAGFPRIACSMSCESHRGVKDSEASGLRRVRSVYCNKEDCSTSRVGGHDMELLLGHVRPSEDIYQASRYLSLELWVCGGAQGISVGSISRRAAFKAKRQS